ncbi:unnamed protein product [Sphagnum troendelagicum]|uniref:Autophagy-related protein 13 N-terminal domain-containing protein n=1 Tax=Sphagnum troendelagicum TaxID=128251 RepID=A0ABP0TY29_9BRYO
MQAEKAKIEQIVSEFFVKSLHVILESRIPFVAAQSQSGGAGGGGGGGGRGGDEVSFLGSSPVSSSSSSRTTNRWFNLELENCNAVQESAEPWRRGIMQEAMVVDILLQQQQQGGPSATLLERWVVHYERRKKPPSTATGGLGLGGTGKVYKRTIIMLRSLYCSVRTLPAHRLFRLANSSSHSQSFSLSYMVSAAPPPLTTGDDRLMSTCRLTPIETQWGKLCVSVAYRSATAVTALEIMPPILPRIIADYVGSPTTDPLRRFSSIGSMPSRGNPGKQGVHMVSLPSSVPISLGRRHSWSGSLNKVAGPPSLPPSSPTFQSASPSPNFHPSPPKPPSSPSGQGHMPSHLSPRTSPLHRPFSQPSSYQGHSNASQPIPIKSRYSPPFSPSPSPSPPAHGYSQQDNVLRSSSAPVSIPRPSNPMRPNSRLPMADPYHQNRGLLPPPSPQSKPAEVMLNRVASYNPRLGHGAQVVGDIKGDEESRLRAKRSLYGSPGLTIGSFRALSKVGGLPHDDMDDGDFACPFAVDDDEVDEIGSPVARPKTADTFESVGLPGSVGAQPHAAVGAFVRFLRSAPPLRELRTPSATFSDLALGKLTSASPQVPVPTHTTDALEELRGYREMRDFLMKQRGGNLASGQTAV